MIVGTWEGISRSEREGIVIYSSAISFVSFARYLLSATGIFIMIVQEGYRPNFMTVGSRTNYFPHFNLISKSLCAGRVYGTRFAHGVMEILRLATLCSKEEMWLEPLIENLQGGIRSTVVSVR
jgi:hypothetical protein